MQVKAVPQCLLQAGRAFIVAVVTLLLGVHNAVALSGYTFQDQCADGTFEQNLQQLADPALQARLQAVHAIHQMNPAPSFHKVFDLSKIQDMFATLSGVSDPLGLASSVISSLVSQKINDFVVQAEQGMMQKMMSQLGQLGAIESKFMQAMCTPLPTLSNGLQGLQQQAALIPGAPMCAGNPIFGAISSNAIIPDANVSPNFRDLGYWFSQSGAVAADFPETFP